MDSEWNLPGDYIGGSGEAASEARQELASAPWHPVPSGPCTGQLMASRSAGRERSPSRPREAIEARGGNAFMEFSLPEAILKFRQGVGRLIRTTNDSGIIAVLDNRVLVKRYGQAFIDALPEMEMEVV